MTKRIPDKREQKRAYKLERSEQARRMKAIQMIVDGRTFREATAAVDRSTGSVREWVGKCLQKHGKCIVRGKIRVKKTGYVFKNRYRTMPGTKKRGPPKGVNRKRAEHKDKVIATEKEHPFERTGRWSQHGLHIDQKERYNIRIK